MPVWLLSATYNAAEYAYHSGRIDSRQWSAYRAIWRYSAPRLSDLVPDSECPQVHVAWQLIEARETVSREAQ